MKKVKVVHKQKRHRTNVENFNSNLKQAGGGKDSFGREALDTLLKLAEDHRDDLIIILAGYSSL